MRLRPGGILWAAPPCSTWVSLCVRSTGRDTSQDGNEESFYVQSQNALVCRMLLASALARSRGAVYTWEQPSDSSMLRRDPVTEFTAAMAGDVREVRMEMGAHGLRSTKPAILWSSAPFVEELGLGLQSPLDRVGLRRRPDKLRAEVRHVDASGQARYQGGKDLKETQAYPLVFGMAHGAKYDNWRRCGGTVAPMVSPHPPHQRSRCVVFGGLRGPEVRLAREHCAGEPEAAKADVVVFFLLCGV